MNVLSSRRNRNRSAYFVFWGTNALVVASLPSSEQLFPFCCQSPSYITYHDVVEVFKRGPDPDRLPYHLRAGMELHSPLGTVAVPFEKQGTYVIPEKYRPFCYLNRLKDFMGELVK